MAEQQPTTYAEALESINKNDRERYERGAQLIDLFMSLIPDFKPPSDEILVAGVLADIAMYCDHGRININRSLDVAYEFHITRKAQKEFLATMIDQDKNQPPTESV